MVLEQLEIYKQVSEPHPEPFIQINSKWITDLSVKCKTFQKKGGKFFRAKGWTKRFLDLIQSMIHKKEKKKYIYI